MMFGIKFSLSKISYIIFHLYRGSLLFIEVLRWYFGFGLGPTHKQINDRIKIDPIINDVDPNREGEILRIAHSQHVAKFEYGQLLLGRHSVYSTITTIIEMIYLIGSSKLTIWGSPKVVRFDPCETHSLDISSEPTKTPIAYLHL